MGILNDEWVEFTQQGIPEVSNLQKSEMEKAFYVGVTVALTLLCNMDDSVTEDEAVVKVEAMHAEVQEYFDSLKQ